jgi:ABC-2 type transport system permease protein
MNEMLVVARKEVIQCLRNRQMLLSAGFMAVIFGGMTVPAMVQRQGGAAAGQATGFFIFMLIGIFMGYLFANQAFMREKQDGSIETLLCAPLSLRQIWFGKVLGVTALAYGIVLIVSAVMLPATSLISGNPAIVSGPLVAFILVVVPVVVAATVGLLGFVQLLLGLRENQIINIGVILSVVILLGLAQELAGTGFELSWTLVGVVLIIALVLLSGVSLLHRFLDRERIVLTLP